MFNGYCNYENAYVIYEDFFYRPISTRGFLWALITFRGEPLATRLLIKRVLYSRYPREHIYPQLHGLSQIT